MTSQSTFPGCDPVEPPKITAEEQAERERLERMCDVAKAQRFEQQRLEADRTIWRRRAEEASRRRGLTQQQRDAEDRDLAEVAALDEKLLEGVP